MILKLIYLGLCFKSALSSSVGSNSESLLTCSKFHFEEKVLEKLVRLEHKMELNDEKMKTMQELFYSKLDKMNEAIKHADLFVETLRENHLQEESRFNESFIKTVKHFNIQSKNETDFYGKQMNIALQSLVEKIHEISETEKNRKMVMKSMWNSFDQEKMSFKQSFNTSIGVSMKQAKTFVESMRDTQLQQQSRLNDSYNEIVEHFKIQARNETEFHGEQINTMLDSLSSKIEEFSDAENKRKKTLDFLQYTLHQEQKRFNQSFDLTLENFRLSSNKTIHDLIAMQQKGYEALLKKRDAIAFSAYSKKSQQLTSKDKIAKFENVWANIGNGYKSSTGIFTAPKQGIYHFSAVFSSAKSQALFLELFHNDEPTSGSYLEGDGYKTGTFDILFNLQKGDRIYVSTGDSKMHNVYSDGDNLSTFSGHLIA
ncbi:Hypothetical predicted protein [Mytilus galloprovincialis]|uniref:C1q domain-containing protein n=1 Tax=Mytilus galloprovincialis TaxID=29158 RepID=A0A8B6BVU0_MYTGA|nr:Hypothetical predicted protein [Mytilus galloprovincialis]